MGLALATVGGVIWEAFARTQVAKIDAFNAKLKQAKKEGLL